MHVLTTLLFFVGCCCAATGPLRFSNGAVLVDGQPWLADWRLALIAEGVVCASSKGEGLRKLSEAPVSGSDVLGAYTGQRWGMHVEGRPLSQENRAAPHGHAARPPSRWCPLQRCSMQVQRLKAPTQNYTDWCWACKTVQRCASHCSTCAPSDQRPTVPPQCPRPCPSSGDGTIQAVLRVTPLCSAPTAGLGHFTLEQHFGYPRVEPFSLNVSYPAKGDSCSFVTLLIHFMVSSHLCRRCSS
jgi:hypothetical protein